MTEEPGWLTDADVENATIGYGDIVRPSWSPAGIENSGRWMVLAGSPGTDPSVSHRQALAICLVPPTNAWQVNEIGPIYINQLERVD